MEAIKDKKYKITKIYPIEKTTSSDGKYAIPYDGEWDNGLKANGFLYFWRKKEAIEEYNKITSNV